MYRIMELEEHVRFLETTCTENKNYIQMMKQTMAGSEDAVNKERAEHATTK